MATSRVGQMVTNSQLQFSPSRVNADNGQSSRCKNWMRRPWLVPRRAKLLIFPRWRLVQQNVNIKVQLATGLAVAGAVPVPGAKVAAIAPSRIRQQLGSRSTSSDRHLDGIAE